MNILVTNDDGFESPGIWALVRAVQDLGNVTVVAPTVNRSGSGTGLSFQASIRVREAESRVAGVPCYAVKGTPGDAAIVGIKHVLGNDIDAVVSGINPGNNTSRNLLISGTLGAAVTACSNGVKAAAFSGAWFDELDDPQVGRLVNAITSELISEETPQATLFNVNFPSVRSGAIQGAEEASPAPSLLQMKLEQHDNGGFEIMSRGRLGRHYSGTGHRHRGPGARVRRLNRCQRRQPGPGPGRSLPPANDCRREPSYRLTSRLRLSKISPGQRKSLFTYSLLVIGERNRSPMLYELRIYECLPGRLPNLHARFANHTMKLFEKHGIKNVGYWVTDVGESNHELTYMVSFENAGQRAEAWESFRNDPDWAKVVEDSHRDGLIVKNVRNQTHLPTPYSPMQ